MRKALQKDIDSFYASVQNDPEIYPYLGIGKYSPRWEEQKDNNSKEIITNDGNSYLLNVSFSWHGQLEFNVALFSKNTFAAGRGLLALFELIKRYRPAYVNTSVQESNIKSLAINNKLWGKPWGIEPYSAWNPIKGDYENLHYFRKQIMPCDYNDRLMKAIIELSTDLTPITQEKL